MIQSFRIRRRRMRSYLSCVLIIVVVLPRMQSAKIAQPIIVTLASSPQYPQEPECLECMNVLTSLIIKSKKLQLATDRNYLCEQAQSRKIKRYKLIRRRARGNIRALATYEKNVAEDSGIEEKDKGRVTLLIKVSVYDLLALMREIQMLLKGEPARNKIRAGITQREQSRREINSKSTSVQLNHHLQMLELSALEPALSFLRARILLESPAYKQIEMRLQELMTKAKNIDCTIAFSTHIPEKDRKRLTKYSRSIKMEILGYIEMIKKTIKAGKDEMQIYHNFVDLATIRLIQLNRLQIKTYFTYIRETSTFKKQKIYQQVNKLVKAELKQLKLETLNAKRNKQLTSPRRKEVLQLLEADSQKGNEVLNELRTFLQNSKPKKTLRKKHNVMNKAQLGLSAFQEYMKKIQMEELRAVVEVLHELENIMFRQYKSEQIVEIIHELGNIQRRIIEQKVMIKKAALQSLERRALTDYINKVNQEVKIYISSLNSLQ